MTRIATRFDKLSGYRPFDRLRANGWRARVFTLRYLRANGGAARDGESPRQPRNVRLNNPTVRPQANAADFSSYRGVVSLLKPCSVPSYLKALCFTPAAFNAVSNGGQIGRAHV